MPNPLPISEIIRAVETDGLGVLHRNTAYRWARGEYAHSAGCRVWQLLIRLDKAGAIDWNALKRPSEDKRCTRSHDPAPN